MRWTYVMLYFNWCHQRCAVRDSMYLKEAHRSRACDTYSTGAYHDTLTLPGSLRRVPSSRTPSTFYLQLAVVPVQRRNSVLVIAHYATHMCEYMCLPHVLKAALAPRAHIIDFKNLFQTPRPALSPLFIFYLSAWKYHNMLAV